MSLPIFKDDSQPFQLMQSQWSSQLNPLLSIPFLNGLALEQVILINGTTVINHRLGRTLQGWFLTGINAAATIYDSQSTNSMKDKTLVLHSNSVATVNLWVF